LDHFLRDEQNDNNHVDVYRLRTAYRKSIPNAISVAKNWLENHATIVISFPMISYTVQTLLSFARDSIFQLEPMTFVNPKTGKTDVAWEAFIKQNLEVPEGKLGVIPMGWPLPLK
jgi:hypothetical protein